MSDDEDSDNDYIDIEPDTDSEDEDPYLNIGNEDEPEEAQEPPGEEAQPQEAEPLIEEGVEGAQPLAQPLGEEGVEGAQPLPLGVPSINDLPANFNFSTYYLNIFGDESSEDPEGRYNSEENDYEQKRSFMHLTTPANKVFVGLNLYEKDLTMFNFDNKTFISCVFIKANLSKVSMRNAVFYDCHCQEINATDANFSGSMIYDCNFFNSKFNNAVMKKLYCKYPNDNQYDRWPSIVDLMASENLILPERNTLMIQFQACDLTNTIFDDSLLDQVDFITANLKYTSMRNCSLVKATFYLAQLNEANFTNANCLEADFSEANCTQVCFNNANLMNANCKNGNFIYCDFRRSKLQECDFTGAGAYLSYSIFQNCQADNIRLTNARLYKCFFSNNSMNESVCDDAKFTGSIIINTSLNDANFFGANCCNVSFTDSQLINVNFEEAILFNSTFVNCTINNLNLNRAFMSEELKMNFIANEVIDENTWEPPVTEPPPNQEELCTIPAIAVPVYNMTGEEGDQPDTNFAQPFSGSFEESGPATAEGPGPATAEGPGQQAPGSFNWNPALETVAELVHPDENEEEEEAPIVDAAGIRIRCPDERDTMVVKEIYKYRNNYMEEVFDLLEFMGTDNYLGPKADPLEKSLRFMNFKNCNFEGINFSRLDLTGVNFFGCVLNDTKFISCIIKDTNFQWSDLISVNFVDINFEGDYNAGGLLEGATIFTCNFVDITFNGEDRSGIYNEFTSIMPYSPKPYPDEDLLTIESPYDVINSNANAIIKSDIEEIQETEVKINDYLEQSPNNLAFRVIDYGNNYSDFLLEKDYVNKFLVNNKSVVYPCRKPFNVPGPSYPGPNETTYHDITRPFVNVGIMIGKRVWVQQDKFMNAYNDVVLHNASAPPTAKKGLAFFKEEQPETVPTFVSKPVLFDNESWVSALHCNSGAEKETLWYVKIVDISAIELPVEEVPAAAEEVFAEGEDPFAFEDEEAPAFQGEWVDPYADESDTDSEPALPAVVTYNPPPDNRTVSIPLPESLFDINNATGKITRMNPETKDITVLSNENIESQFNSAKTATIALIVKDGDVTTNYIVKFNDFIELFRNNRQDYIPCKNLADNTDIAKDRRLINIGAIIKKQIFIDKRQIIELFPNNSAVLAAKKTRTFYLQFNENSEKIPGVTKFDLAVPMCKAPAITVWDLQRFPNNFYQVNDVVKLLLPAEHAGELFQIAPIPALDSQIFINTFDNVPADVQQFTLAVMPDITIENGKIFKTVTDEQGDQPKIRHYFLQNSAIGHPILVPSDAFEKEVEALVQMTEGAQAPEAPVSDFAVGATVFGHDDYLGDFQGTIIITPKATTNPLYYITVYFKPLRKIEGIDGVYTIRHTEYFQNPVFQANNNINVTDDGKIFMNGERQYIVQLVSSVSGYERNGGRPAGFYELRPASQLHLDDGFNVGDVVVGESETYGKFEGTIMSVPENYPLGMADEIYNGHVYLWPNNPAKRQRKYLVKIDNITTNVQIPIEPELFLASKLTLKNPDEPAEAAWPPPSPESPHTPPPHAPHAHTPPPPDIIFNDGDLITGFHEELGEFEGTISSVADYLEEYELPYNNDAHSIRARLYQGHIYFGDELNYFVDVTRIEGSDQLPTFPIPIAAVDIELRNPVVPPEAAVSESSNNSVGGGAVRLHGHNTTLRRNNHHNHNNTMRKNFPIHHNKSRHLIRKFKKAFTRRAKH